MAANLKPGARVSWKSHCGTAHGKVVKKLTGSSHIKGHKVAASPEEPQFLVKTDEGKRAAHKPSALSKD